MHQRGISDQVGFLDKLFMLKAVLKGIINCMEKALTVTPFMYLQRTQLEISVSFSLS